MRIAIMAAGGVGGFLGARLVEAGADVAILARGRHLEAIRADGLTLATPQETFTVRPRLVTADPEEIGPVDIIIFAVKLPDLVKAATSLRPMLTTGTGVIPFQNGVEAASLLAGIVGPEHAMTGTCYIFADIAEPGRIRVSGAPGRFFFGEADGSQSDRATSFRDLLKGASVDAPQPADVRVEVWRKFAYLSALSGVTALTRSPVGAIREDTVMRATFNRALVETIAVARARGINLPDDSIQRFNHFLDSSPPGATSSLARDLEAGRPLEAPWLSGAVERFGRESGIDTPVHMTIYAALRPFIDGAKEPVPPISG